MKKLDLLVISTVALVTMLIAWSAFSVMPSATAVGQEIKKPRPALVAEGVVLTLEPDKTTYEVGEMPAVTLNAVNTQDGPVKLEVAVSMARVSLPTPSGEMSRSMPMQSPVSSSASGWSNSCKVELAAGETKTFVLPTGVALDAGSIISFTIKVGGKSVVAARASVPAQAAQATKATQRAEQAK